MEKPCSAGLFFDGMNQSKIDHTTSASPQRQNA
jgi:hypothetical protein